MEIVKKNLISIICGVIALLAIGAVFWPIGRMYDKEQANLGERKKTAEDLYHVKTAQRYWPVPEAETGKPVALTHFPNAPVISAADAIMAEIHKQAGQMKSKTDQYNEHELLVPGALPTPSELRFRFANEYLKLVQVTLPGPDYLSATTPPTRELVHAEADKLWKAKYEPKIITVAGKDVNREQTIKDWQDECTKLWGKLRADHAEGGKLYMDPTSLAISKAMLGSAQGGGPKEGEIWFAQNMAWVQLDVADAIRRINQASTRVSESPIKQILHLDIPEDATMYVMSAGGAATSSGTTATAEAPGKAYSRTPTGRVSNSLYDVLQFTLVINVDGRKVPAILAELQKDRLITVTQFDIFAVDAIAAAEDGYLYGDVPVVQLNIKGEDLFLRDWTVKLMPDSIRQVLGVTAPTAAAR